MAAESSGAEDGAHWRADFDGDSLWVGPLQQAGGALQLALCAAGGCCGRLLWARMAQQAAGGSLGDYTRLGGRDLVLMAALTESQRACGRRSDSPVPRACYGAPLQERRWR